MIALLIAVVIQDGSLATAAHLIERGHFKRARPLLETALRANSADPEALHLTSQLAVVWGNLDSARALAERAVKLDSANADYHYQLGSVAGQQAQRASILRRPGLAGKFRAEMNEALQRDSTHVLARFAMVQFYLQAPGIMGGDKKKARALAEGLVRTHPATGYSALLDVVIAEGDTTRREELLRKAVEVDPTGYDAGIDFASFVVGRDSARSEAAEREARALAVRHPDRPGGYALLAIILATQQRWSDLDSMLAQAERLVPDNLGPEYQAARVLQTRGDSLGRAERYLRHYLEEEPEGDSPGAAAAHWRLGLVLEKQGKLDEARREIDLAVKLQPTLEQAKKDAKRLRR